MYSLSYQILKVRIHEFIPLLVVFSCRQIFSIDFLAVPHLLLSFEYLYSPLLFIISLGQMLLSFKHMAIFIFCIHLQKKCQKGPTIVINQNKLWKRGAERVVYFGSLQLWLATNSIHDLGKTHINALNPILLIIFFNTERYKD